MTHYILRNADRHGDVSISLNMIRAGSNMNMTKKIMPRKELGSITEEEELPAKSPRLTKMRRSKQDGLKKEIK